MKSQNFLLVFFMTLAVSVSCRHADTPAPPDTVSVAPTGVKIDPHSVSPENNGMQADLDGDGVVDFMIMRGQTLFWKRSNQGEEIALLNVNLPGLYAYHIGPTLKNPRPSLYLYTTNNDEFLCENLATGADARPIFGSIENTIK